MRYRKSLTAGWQRLAVACVLANQAAIVVATEVEPYEAQVIVDRAQVRSGPGENFYPTSALAAGETVEVYREHAGGWLAIRPPQSSFSWVIGRHLRIGDDGLALVDKENVASCIGSGFGDKRNAVQLQLRKGEVVEVLGKEEVRGETWYKITPPAGEFRWIHSAQVNRLGPLNSSDANAVADEKLQEVVTASANENSTAPADRVRKTPVDNEASASAPVAAAPADDEWRAAPVAAAASAGATAAALPPPLISSVTAPAAAEATVSADPPAASPSPAPAPPGAQAPDTVTRQLTDIELRLSRMVAAPPHLWNTERLERDTEELLARAQTAEEREAAKAMLAKLDRFAALGQRHNPLSGSGGDGERGSIEGELISSSPPLPVSPAGYDAVGILRPVVSKRPGAPQFALVDDRGQVISFVTPTPDVNLQPYLGHRVGVVGTRGFIPEFHRAHVTAGRVTPLTEGLMR